MARDTATRAGPIRAHRAGHRDGPALALPGAWVRYAACGPATAELFFPISDTGPAARDAAKAKALCASCPVHAECRADAENTGEQHGIWGGLTPTERHPQPHQEAA